MTHHRGGPGEDATSKEDRNGDRGTETGGAHRDLDNLDRHVRRPGAPAITRSTAATLGRAFHQDEDCAAHAALFSEGSLRVPIRLLAYVLKPHHFNLVLWPQGCRDRGRHRRRPVQPGSR